MVKTGKFFLFLVLTGTLFSSVGLSGSSYYVSQVLAESSNLTETTPDRNNEANVAESESIRGEPSSRNKEFLPEANHPPRAHAGPDVVVNEKDNVILNAEKSTDPDGDKLSYSWIQVSPKKPHLDLKNFDSKKASFVASEIDANSFILTFLLTVEDNNGGVAIDTVKVKVNNLPEEKKSAKSKESSSDNVTKNEIKIKQQAARPKLGTLTPKQFDSKFKDNLGLDRNLGLTDQKLPPHKMTAQEVGGDFSGTFNYQEDVTRHHCAIDNQGKIGCEDSKFVVSVSSPISGSFEHDFVYSGPAQASCSLSETRTYDGVPTESPPPFKVGGFVNPLALGGSSSLLGGYMTITDSSLVGGCGLTVQNFPLSQTANGAFKSEGNVQGFDCNPGGEGTCIRNYGWNLVLQPVTPPPPPNNPPTANDQTVSTDQDIPKIITLTGSDPDNDLLSYTILTQPSHGSLAGNPGNPPVTTYTPAPGYTGSDTFTFKVNDGKVDSNNATVSISVNANVCKTPTTAQKSLTTKQLAVICSLTITAKPSELNPLISTARSTITIKALDSSGKPIKDLVVRTTVCTTIGSITDGHPADGNNGEGCSQRPLPTLNKKTSEVVEKTNAGGTITITYVPPKTTVIKKSGDISHLIAGEDKITALATVADNPTILASDASKTLPLVTKVKNLNSFDVGCATTAEYVIISADNHGCLFYGTGDTNQAIRDIAAQFNNLQQVCADTLAPDFGCDLANGSDKNKDVHVAISGPPVPIRITAMSLPWGGLYDIGPSTDCVSCILWQPPHSTHKSGKEVDLGFKNIDKDDDRKVLLRFVVKNHANLKNIVPCEGGFNILTAHLECTKKGFPKAIADHIHANFVR